MAARIDAAAAQRKGLEGTVGRSNPWWQTQWQTHGERSAQPQTQPPRPSSVAGLRPESRALAALGYPFWPLALLALFDPSRSQYTRRNAWQALGFNFGMYGLAWLMSAIAEIPLIGISAWPLLPFIVPVTIVASVVFAIKAWHGDEVHVPFVSDIVDARLHQA
jgi:uncharacterized membrane protein